MIYSGQFKNINNTLYQIDIFVNNNITGTTEINLSSDPFVVEYSEGDTIFEPLKISNATCNILSENYILDLYQPTAKGAKIKITNLDDNTINWIGYITSNMYNQAYDQKYENISVECIDGIGILEYFKYTTTNNIKSFITFEKLLIDIIKKTECYSNIYINKNSHLYELNDGKIIDKLLISEALFFDDDNESNTYKYILNEVIKYMNNTLIAYGDSIYILDYNYIANNGQDYYKYSTTDNWSNYTITSSTLVDLNEITSNSFKSTGTNLSLDNIYNCASVSTSEKKIDSLIPDIFNDENLTNTGANGADWNYTIPKTSGETTYIFKFMTDENWENPIYSITDNSIVAPSLYHNDTTLYNYKTSSFSKITNYNTNDGTPVNLNFTDYVIFATHYKIIQSDLTEPMLKLKSGIIPESSFYYDDYYILFKGSLFPEVRKEVYFPDEKLSDHGNVLAPSTVKYIFKAKLKIGDKYYNGSGWTASETTFTINCTSNEKYIYNRWVSFDNNVMYSDFIGDEGYKIKINKSDNLIGNVELSIYEPKVDAVVNYLSNISYFFLKDFEIKLIKPNKNKNDDTDTNYKNIINIDFVNEFNDVEFILNSDTGKGLSYSTVIQNINGEKTNNDNITMSNKNQKPEYHFIENIVNQYSQPKKKFSLIFENKYKPYSCFYFNNIQNEKYIIKNMSINYFNNTNELSIVEKYI